MNVCFLQIETLNNKAREEGGESQKRREGYGFIYCPNHVKHETGIYNTVLRAVERGGGAGRGERLEGTERGVRMRGREHKWRERGMGMERLWVGDERRVGLAQRQSEKEKGISEM